MIAYTLEKGRVKNIYLRVRDGKVYVKAPYYVTKRQIEELLVEKENWIKNSIAKEQKRKEEEKEPSKEEIEKLAGLVKKAAIEYSRALGVIPNKIRLRSIQYAWGSCSGKKNITINSKLATHTEEEIRYVVLHELCHLKYMNHSKAFWALVESQMPDYKKIRKKMRE